eukprot:g17060.t1
MTSNLLAALKSNQGKTSTTAVYPLIEAAKSGQVEGCSKALEDKKVKVDQKDPEGVNALMHAASGGYIQVVQFLVDKGARISAKDDMGETALMKACKEGHTDIIRFLVEAQAAQRKKGPSLTGGKDEAQQSLMREKKRILDMKDDEGVNLGCMKPILCSELVLLYYASAICLICCLARTAIMKAAEQGEGDVVQILADDGASLDLKDDEGWDVLMWASLSGHYEICELLVSNFGITADYATEKGETALMKAAANGHWDVCGFLIGEGAKVNQLDQHHQTALMWAASEGHLTTVQGLVKKDAKVDQVTKQGKTALLLAAQFGREEICKFLVAKGAKVEHQDEDGQTALFSAVMDLTAEDGDDAEEFLMDKVPPQFEIPGKEALVTVSQFEEGLPSAVHEDEVEMQSRAPFSSKKAGSGSFLRGPGAECCICCAELPSDAVCMLMQRSGRNKKRACRHYLHHGCAKLLLQSTPAPYLCPLCRAEFVRVEALPDVRLNSTAWFHALDDDDSGSLEKHEVIDALCATLPVDPEKLEAVKLWSEWDSEGASDLG